MKRLTIKATEYGLDEKYGYSSIDRPANDINQQIDMYNKLGKLEDLIENADYIRIIKRNGVASLHIDMILDDETYPIAEQLFGKEKVIDYDK